MNSVFISIYQFIENLVHTFNFKIIYLDKDDPWSGILADTAFTVLSTYHTKLQATPVQLVSGFNMILNTPFITDWEDIRIRKQQIIDKNNQNENKNCKLHFYEVSEKLQLHDKK